MHILIDIGNTNVLFGKFESTKLLDQLRVETNILNNELLLPSNETQKKIINFSEKNVLIVLFQVLFQIQFLY